MLTSIAIITEKDGEAHRVNSTKVRVDVENGTLYLYPEGYGDASTEDGEGCPVMIERWNGELRVVVWSDINKEDPTHIISLEGARESLRDHAFSS